MESFSASIAEGTYYPRWLNVMAGGYGYPTFLFYPPGFWFAAYPWTLFFSDITVALKCFLFAAFAIAGLGAYKLARLYCRSEFAWCCAGLFLACPNLLFLLYKRGALAEMCVALWLPWLFYYVMQVLSPAGSRHGRYMLILSMLLAVLIYFHPLTIAIALVPVVGMLCIKAMQGEKRGVLRVLLSMLVAFVLASPYWLPMLQLRDAVNYLNAFHFRGDFLERHSFSNTFIRLGIVNAILGVAGLVSTRSIENRFYLVVICILLIICLPVSEVLWKNFEAMQLFLGPVRVYPALGLLFYLGICRYMRVIQTHLAGGKLYGWAVVANALMALALIVFGVANIFPKHPLDYAVYAHKTQMTFDTMTHGGEFKPRLASMRGLENRFGAELPLVEWDKKGKSGQITNLQEKNGHIVFDVLPTANNKENQPLTSIRVNQFYLPGWRAQLDGANLPFHLDAYKNTSDSRKNTVDSFAYVDYNGRIGIALPLNKPHTVRLWYDGPPYWEVRNGLIGAVFVFFIYLIFVRKPKSILPTS